MSGYAIGGCRDVGGTDMRRRVVAVSIRDPQVAGFVCSPGDSPQWCERVERVWTAYFKHASHGCGSAGFSCSVHRESGLCAQVCCERHDSFDYECDGPWFQRVALDRGSIEGSGGKVGEVEGLCGLSDDTSTIRRRGKFVADEAKVTNGSDGSCYSGSRSDANFCERNDALHSVGSLCESDRVRRIDSVSLTGVRLADDQLGPNTLRNRKARQEKKQRKIRKQLRDASFGTRLHQIKQKKNWRDGDVVDGDDGNSSLVRGPDEFKSSQGFWNSCSNEIRQQLIDSKAQMHIAENRRKKVAADLRYQQDQAALSAANSVPVLVSQLVAVSKLANQLVKTTKDDQVHGWAKTVADSLTRSVAESAISKSDSLPSLESVGYGDSALRSSDGESAKSRRLLLYQAKVEEFDKLVEDDRFETVNQEVAYKKNLDDEYADVLLSEREFFEKKMTDNLINYYTSNGKGVQEIELAIAGMGLPPRDLHTEFYSEI